MRKKWLTILVSVVLTLMCFPFNAIHVNAMTTDNGLMYHVSNGTATIIGCTENVSSHLVIPSAIDGWTVTAIGYGAFDFCDQIVTVTIPDTVSSIGAAGFNADTFASTFVGCTYLEAINVSADNPNYYSDDGVLFDKRGAVLTIYPSAKKGDYIIPDGIQWIREGAFYNCENLGNIYIPSSVSRIDFGTWGSSRGRVGSFYNCTNLKAFVVAPSNTKYSSQDGVLFNADKTSLYQFPWAKQGEYVFPDSVVSIARGAFYNSTELTGVVFSTALDVIDDFVFMNCTRLTTLTFGCPIANIFTYFGPNITDVYYRGSKWDDDDIYENKLVRCGLNNAEWHFDWYTPAQHHVENVKYSVMDTDRGTGLAFKFTVNVRDVCVNNNTEADLTYAFVYCYGATCKVVGMGAVLTNKETETDLLVLEKVDNERIVNIPAVFLCDLEKDSCSFATRIINIPNDQLESVIYARPYYIVDINGENVVVYGNVNSAFCAKYM